MHQEVYLLIDKISYEKSFEKDYNSKTKEVLIVVSRNLLKEELERVKLEVKMNNNGLI